jgi:glycosyltransferase involved in cell wall biosynthesis
VIEKTNDFVDNIIVVDDGSSDNTYEVAASANSVVVRNKRNMGKGFALRRGILEALKNNPDIVVMIDADGQHDPSDIPKLLEPILNEDADIVIGSRYAEKSSNDVPPYRKIGLSIINLSYRLVANTSVRDTQSGFRAYSKNVLSSILKYDAIGYGVEVEQLAIAESQGFKIVEVPTMIKYSNLENISKGNPFVHGMTILSTLFRVTVERKPLLFFGTAGVFFLIVAIFSSSVLLAIFNHTRYFSIPLALISIGATVIGLMMISVSLILYALKRIRQREEIIATTLLDLLNKDKHRI